MKDLESLKMDLKQNRFKMVIIDEFSMVDIQLAARLLASLEEGCRIVLVGDEDQLPSVEPGQVLSDLIACKEIKTIKLDQIIDNLLIQQLSLWLIM